MCIWDMERHPQSLASPRDSVQASFLPFPGWTVNRQMGACPLHQACRSQRGRTIPSLISCPGMLKANLSNRFLCSAKSRNKLHFGGQQGGRELFPVARGAELLDDPRAQSRTTYFWRCHLSPTSAVGTSGCALAFCQLGRPRPWELNT